ncbi:hypothetical protein V1477_008835 [Vespula maculifrons]|uniref:Uncharacterized protein n=1 Tax=Vespula maculifrons TaxID=7453 RepID=A0ABD2CE56_VESMC
METEISIDFVAASVPVHHIAVREIDRLYEPVDKRTVIRCSIIGISNIRKLAPQENEIYSVISYRKDISSVNMGTNDIIFKHDVGVGSDVKTIVSTFIRRLSIGTNAESGASL